MNRTEQHRPGAPVTLPMADLPELSRTSLRRLAQLQQKKFRQEQGLFLAEGRKIVEEALASQWPIRQIVVSQEFLDRHPEALAQLPAGLVTRTDAAGTAKLSSLSTPPGILAIAETRWTGIAELLAWERPLLYCDGLADPGNLGTVLRTADWFGIADIALGPGTADPFSPKTMQASMGSLFRLRLCQEPEALVAAKRSGRRIVVTEGRAGRPLIGPGAPLCLVLGSEAHGASPEARELADIRYGIPGSGRAESLNVSVAAGIVLYDLAAVQKAL